jgi:hypothetical protein
MKWGRMAFTLWVVIQLAKLSGPRERLIPEWVGALALLAWCVWWGVEMVRWVKHRRGPRRSG